VLVQQVENGLVPVFNLVHRKERQSIEQGEHVTEMWILIPQGCQAFLTNVMVKCSVEVGDAGADLN